MLRTTETTVWPSMKVKTKNGKLKRSFELVSNLEAAQYFKASADRETYPDMVPLGRWNGFPLKCILKTGNPMVLFLWKIRRRNFMNVHARSW